jgi:photosystem II stability/assembly factor-like uncharacterized protein
MKTKTYLEQLLLLAFAVSSSAVLLFRAPSASAATVVSNLGETTDGGFGITFDGESSNGFAVGQFFTTGAQASTLNSVTLDLQMLSSGPFSVGLYSYNGTNPWTNPLLNLTPTAIFAGGLNTFTGAYALTANTSYWIVVNPQDNISLAWTATNSLGQTSNSGWIIGDSHGVVYLDKDNNGWQNSAPSVGRMSIDATVVPEPTSAVLLLFGASLCLQRSRKKSL